MSTEPLKCRYTVPTLPFSAVLNFSPIIILFGGLCKLTTLPKVTTRPKLTISNLPTFLRLIAQFVFNFLRAIQNMKYFRNFTKDGLNLSPYMVATYESINN